MPLPSGSRLGPYEIVALLGVGGMGEVYRARDSRLDRTVAIKLLAPQIATAPGFRERFESVNRDHTEQLAAIFRRASVDVLPLSTDDDLIRAIMRFAAMRKQRKRQLRRQ